MIVKALMRDHSSVIQNDRWVYVDRISKVQTHGYVRPSLIEADAEALVDRNARRISVNRDELRLWVEQAWGIERQFADELWPEFRSPDEQQTVTCLHLTRDDDSMVLALVSATTFLLSDDGKTIDRLH